MTLVRDISIVLIIAVVLFFVISHFFLRTNIIWDEIVQGLTGQGGHSNIGYSGSDANTTISNMSTTVKKLINACGQTSLIVPNSAFPPVMTSNIMFTIWFFIDDYTQNLGQAKYVCSLIGEQGGSQYSPSLIVFLTPYNNNLGIALRTQNSSSSSETFNFYFIDNIPLQKWNCLTLSIIDRTLDVYLEGKLVNSYILEGFYSIKNNTSLYIGNNSNQNFAGFITRARYDNGGVNPQQAYEIYKDGIKTSFAGDFLNRYRLKVGLYEYNNRVGGFTV